MKSYEIISNHIEWSPSGSSVLSNSRFSWAQSMSAVGCRALTTARAHFSCPHRFWMSSSWLHLRIEGIASAVAEAKPEQSRFLFLKLVGGLNPPKKYERQLGRLFPIYGKNMATKTPTRKSLALPNSTSTSGTWKSQDTHWSPGNLAIFMQAICCSFENPQTLTNLQPGLDEFTWLPSWRIGSWSSDPYGLGKNTHRMDFISQQPLPPHPQLFWVCDYSSWPSRWRFPETGLPPVIIHFRWGFSTIKNHPASYWGSPHDELEPPDDSWWPWKPSGRSWD